MTHRPLTALLLAAAALLARPAAAAPVPAPAPATVRAQRMAVLDFSLAGSAHPDLARVLSDGAAKGAEGNGYQIVTQGEVAAVLGLDRLRQLLGCSDDQGCLSDAAHALDAERLLSGSLTILERTALVTVRLIDAPRGRTIARTSTTLLDATEKELVDAARRLAYEAVTGKRLDTSGLLRLHVDRPGAQVTLDGKELGRTPLTGTPRVLEGPHSIVIQKDGYVRWSSTVAVPPGGDVPVDVQLIPVRLLGEAARSRLWSWAYVTTGVAVAAAGNGLVFHKLAEDSYTRYKRATNRTAAADLRDQVRTRNTIANVSFGVAGASALSAGTLFILAARADAHATAGPGVALLPAPGGLLLAGTF
jgi:hypothetical protein